MENIVTIATIIYAVILLCVFTFDPIMHVISSRKAEREQAEIARSPYNKGYTAFDINKTGAKQSFIHKLLEDPKYVQVTRDEKLYRIREIMQETMIRYGSSWITQDMEPHKNSEGSG